MKTTTIASLLAAAAMTSVASAQFWTVSPNFGISEGVSNNGVVSGSALASGGQYFAWTANGGASLIGGVSAGQGVGGRATISNDGRYIGGTVFNAVQNYHEMGRYDRTTGVWQGFGAIPTIGTQIDSSVSSGWGMSGDGRNVVGLGWTTEGTADAHAMQWREGTGVIDLGTATVGNSSRANAASFDGSVVAGWQDGAGRQGAAWVNGVQELIFNGANPAQEAFDVSDDGVYVVGMGIGSFFSAGNAYRYNTVTNTYQALPNLASGAAQRMAAAAVNGDGTLIGGGTWGTGPATFGRGFIWAEGVGTMSVALFLEENGVAFDPNFNFSFVSAISADGQWLTGWGNIGGPGNTQTWVARIPAPGTAGLLALGGLVGVRCRR